MAFLCFITNIIYTSSNFLNCTNGASQKKASGNIFYKFMNESHITRNENIKEFTDILEEQSFKNINVIIIDNIMDKIIDLIKYVIKENKDCLFINHERYIREDYKQDNLIYERICDTITDIINDNKIENFTVFKTEEEGKDLINKDFYISNKKSKELISIIDNIIGQDLFKLKGNNEELLRILNESIDYKHYLYN